MKLILVTRAGCNERFAISRGSGSELTTCIQRPKWTS